MQANASDGNDITLSSPIGILGTCQKVHPCGGMAPHDVELLHIGKNFIHVGGGPIWQNKVEYNS